MLREGEREQRELIVAPARPKPPAAALAPPPRPSSPPPSGGHDVPRSGNGQRIFGLALAGGGLVGLGLGAFFGVRADSSWSDAKSACRSPTDCRSYPDAIARHDAAVTSATASTVAFAAGAALLAVGAIVYLVAPSPRRSTSADRLLTITRF